MKRYHNENDTVLLNYSMNFLKSSHKKISNCLVMLFFIIVGELNLCHKHRFFMFSVIIISPYKILSLIRLEKKMPVELKNRICFPMTRMII